MIEQFRRSFRLQVGSIQIESIAGTVALRTRFQIRRDSTRDPDEAAFEIWNLNEDHRSELEENELLSLVFEAGYQDNVQQLFAGVLRRAYSYREGSNWITTVTLGDGEAPAVQQARVSKTYPKGGSLKGALQDLIRATGLDEGNLEDVVQVARMVGSDKFRRGKTISGPPLPVLYRLVRSFGFGYTIQDGRLVFHSDKSQTGEGVILRPDTGLLGVPKLDSKGNLQCQALLNADLRPRQVVQLESRSVTGRFVIREAAYAGDSYGPEWTVDLVASPVG